MNNAFWDNLKLTVVVPAKNENGVIIDTLKEIKSIVRVPYNILVVDDLSSDDTVKMVKEYSKKEKNVFWTKTTKEKHGFASAIKRGFDFSKTEYVVVVMADLCDNPRTINLMYKKINEGWDIVCGSRYASGGKKVGGPKLQGLLSEVVCRTLKFFGVPTTDVSNAFKMYRKNILKDVNFNYRGGVEASMETTLQAFFNGAKISDIPTSWRGRTIGKSKFKLFQRAPKYLRIYLWTLGNLIRKRFGVKTVKYSLS